MIPAARLNPRAVGALMEYLRHEIYQAESERRSLEEKWIKYHRAYKCLPDVPVRDFPFVGAANFVVPVIATDVDTLFSRLMGILFGPENLWSIRPLRPDMIQFAARLQEFLQWAQHNELEVYNSIADWVLEICKLGTSVLKQRYKREVKRVFQFRESDFGTVEEHLMMLLHDHPVLEYVSIFDFLVPSSTKTIQSAPWVAERLNLTWSQLQNRVRSGVYQDVDRLAMWRYRGEQPEWFKQLLSHDTLRPNLSDSFDIREIWLDFDITGVDGPEALVCTVHIPSMTYLRIDYNPYFNQERPYSAARYLRQEGRFYGIGLAEMLEQTQEEITTLRRQRIDNNTLSNAPMMGALRGEGVREDEPVVPGRWVVVNSKDGVFPLNMGRPLGDVLMGHEQTAISYAQRRTGVSDYVTGEFSPAMGYSTASVGVQNLREAAKRFDQTMREIRVALGESGTRIVELYQQFNQNGKEYLAMGDADGALVHQVLQFPLDMIRAGVGVELTATSAAFNKEVEIRTNTIIMQMMTQFYTQSMQAMSYVLNPQLPPPIRQMAWMMVNGGSIMLRRILDNYGIQDADRLVPEMEALLNNGQQQLSTIGGIATGGPFGAQANVQQQGLAGLLTGGAGAPAIGMAGPGQFAGF